MNRRVSLLWASHVSAIGALVACGPGAVPNTGSDSLESTTTGGDVDSESTDRPASAGGSTSSGAPTTAATDSDPGTGVGTTDCNFLSCQEQPDLPPPLCDVFTQDCPADEKCAAYATGEETSWNATRCVAVTGDQLPGEPCTATGSFVSGIDDCVRGAMCWHVDLDLHGVCFAQCTGTFDAPVCPDHGACLTSSDLIIVLCLPVCDPLVQDCPVGEVCIPAGWNFACELDYSSTEGQLNDPCVDSTQCDPGLGCVEVSTASSACDPQHSGCCQPFCRFPGAPCPNPDQACVSWFDPETLPPGDPRLEIGICKIAS